MPLSEDLVSLFVKATKDTKKTPSESTVYGTVVMHNDRKFVQIDGSDQLTPVETTTAALDGERVTVLIKDHTATITGNLSSPSARNEDVQNPDGIITQVEILVADRVSTSQLSSELARIDTIYAKEVDVGNRLTAQNAEIAELKTKNATIEGTLEAATGDIDNLKTTTLTTESAKATYATIENLDVINQKVLNLESTYGEFEDLEAVNAAIKELQTDKLDAEEATVKYATISELKSAQAVIGNLKVDVADINTLIFGSASGSIVSSVFANAVIARLGNAQIKSAMIDSVAADKITAGDILTGSVNIKSEDGKLLISDETIQISDDTRVRVQIGKDADEDYSINVWDVEGNLMFSKGGITDSAIKEAIIRNDMISETANISASKLDIDSLFEKINDSTKTINATRVHLDDKNQTLDVAFESMQTDVNGLSDTVSSQGTQISVIQGKIDSKVWQQDIDDATEEMSTNYSSLEQTIGNVSTTVAEHTTQLGQKADQTVVDGVSTRVSQLEVTATGLTSRVVTAETKVNKAQSDIDSLSIGGRNILKNSRHIQLHSNNSNLYPIAYEILSENGREFMRYTRTATTLNPTTLSMYSAMPISQFTEDLYGIEITASFLIRSSHATTTTLMSAIATGSGSYNWRTDNTAYSIGQEWVRLSGTGTITQEYDPETETVHVRFNPLMIPIPSGEIDNFYVDVCEWKFEKGNRATDWTPAPEDMSTVADMELVRTTAENAQELSARSETLIQQLTDSISTLVTDGNGTSLMTQTESGWTFSTADIQTAVATTAENLDVLTNELGDTTHAVDVLQQAVNDLGEIAEYVKIGTYENQPCIELGESDSEFKLRITNTQIMFMEGSNIVAHINNQSLHIKKAVIEEELQQGGFVWKVRSNGNMGLVWKGVSS